MGMSDVDTTPMDIDTPTADTTPCNAQTAQEVLTRCKSMTPMVEELVKIESEQAAFNTRLRFRWQVCCLKSLNFNECMALKAMEIKLREPLTKFFQAAFLAIDAMPTETFQVLPTPTTKTPARELINVATDELYNFITMINGDDHVVPEATKGLIQTMGCHLEPIVNECLTPVEINDLTTFFKSPIWKKLRNNHPAFHEALLITLSTRGQEQFKAILTAMSELI
jgi:hypothetical protein